jgi:hypothetical protein
MHNQKRMIPGLLQPSTHDADSRLYSRAVCVCMCVSAEVSFLEVDFSENLHKI